MLGQTISHYRVLDRLGAGAMGVVYRARDERLDRDVALKVLAPGLLANEQARKRFRQEARALSRINHPNIATIHDFDSQAGVDLLAMEYVPGETLSDMTVRGAVPEPEVVRLGLQLAEGLAAAHAQGVIHRDLKPGNLRVTPDGRLKILDFGLAKLALPAAGEAATESAAATEGAIGTLPYMAPEQLCGGPVDARTDVYAAGVVLYELATGRRPFSDPLAPALTDAILHQPPLLPGRVRPEVSPALEAIILRCLEKDPGVRYQTAADLLADLRRLATTSTTIPAARPARPRRVRGATVLAGAVAAVAAVVALLLGLDVGGLRTRLFGAAAPPAIQSLAVLPLENFSGDPAQDYFAAGMTEALTTDLSRIGALRVVGRTSAMRFGGAKQPIPEIARALGVDAVVEGSVLREGNRVRITAQLVAANPERHLWANSYDRELRDVLAVHSEVAQAIAREIRVTLTPDQQARLGRARPVNPAALEPYIRARVLLSQMMPGRLAEAMTLLDQAIATDPSFAPAHASRATAMMLRAIFGADAADPRQAVVRTRAAAARALELDPAQPEALMVEGFLTLYFDWDWPAAERQLKRALELDPNNGLLYHPYADYLLVTGRLEESLDYTRRGAVLDPFSPLSNAVVGGHLSFLRRFDEAAELFRRQADANPGSPNLRLLLAPALWEKGAKEEAVAEFRRTSGAVARVLSGVDVRTPPMVAAREVAQALEARAKTDNVNAFDVAQWFARAGDADRTMEWLERAYDRRTPFLLHVKASATFDLVRSDPRFAALLKRIGFPE